MRPRQRLAGRGLIRPAAALATPVLLGLAVAGCGGISAASTNVGNQLTIYSSLPLQGASAPIALNIVNGEKLALSQAGGQVGSFKVGFVSLDDSSPVTGQWEAGATATNAKTAAQDKTTIAYLGDYNSGATAVSLPLINAAGILQVSPGSPYVGLTSAQHAGQDEPDRFYPTGKRNFGRLMPADQVQGAAVGRLLSSVGVRRLYVIGDQNPFEAALAGIVATDAQQAGVQVVGHDSVDTTARDFSGEVAKLTRTRADGVFMAGGSNPGMVRLWREVYAALPQARLVGSSALDVPAFTGQLGPAARNTLIATPTLALPMYPPAAQRFFHAYREQFRQSPSAYALYGYEAMQVTLQAIRDARGRGNNRGAVIQSFFGIHDRDSVLGRYSITPSGDTTLEQFGVDRVVGGRPVFWRVLQAGGAA